MFEFFQFTERCSIYMSGQVLLSVMSVSQYVRKFENLQYKNKYVKNKPNELFVFRWALLKWLCLSVGQNQHLTKWENNNFKL